MTQVRVAVVQAGLGTPSTTSRLADVMQKVTLEELEAAVGAPEVTVSRVDVRDFAVMAAEATVSGVRREALEDALTAVEQADVIVAVTPTFNASYAGVFKMFFDLLEPRALEGTPVILGATGGTSRHSLVTDLAMRPLFAYLRALPVATSVFASTDDFAGGESVQTRARAAAREAVRLWGGGQASAGTPGAGAAEGQAADASSDSVVHSPMGDFTSFTEVMKGLRR